MQLSITNVVTISVSEANPGIGNYNTSNLAIFTDEIPADSFGDDGFASYVDPTQVEVDFGSTSRTFAMANAVFSQQPNILGGSGQLVIILLATEAQDVTLSGAPTSGSFKLSYDGNTSEVINFDDTAAEMQETLQALPGLESVLVTGTMAGALLHISLNGVYGNIPLLTVSANTLANGGGAVTATPSQITAGETLAAAISRTSGLVQFFGILVNQTLEQIGQTELLAIAAVIQPLNKMGFFVTPTEDDVETGGMVDLLRSGGFTKTRGLFYGAGSVADCVVMAASYASRALSTNFSGSNTTQTMHLKTLTGVQTDPSMTQSILNKCIAAGADSYVSLQGVPAVYCSGANKFFDQVYNLCWFVGALQVAGFNYLAQASTKIPQTETGITGLKGAYRQICQAAVNNQYAAPGSWTSPSTFGNTADLILNVSQVGYYLYSLPIAQQLQSDRLARKAPLVQIALKEAGAVHESSVIINVNA